MEHFKVMLELEWQHGYPAALIMVLLAPTAVGVFEMAELVVILRLEARGGASSYATRRSAKVLPSSDVT
jgi:hypothetical protein